MPVLIRISRLWPRKLSQRLVLLNLSILCITILGFAWYSASLQTQQRLQNERAQVIIFTKNIAALAAKYLQSNEYDQLETKLDQLIHYPGVNSIQVINNSTHYILSVKRREDQTIYTETEPETPQIPKQGEKWIQDKKDAVDFWQNVVINKAKNKTGWVKVEYDTRPLNQISLQILKHSLSIAFCAIVLSLVALKKVLSGPMRELRRASEFAEYLDLAQGNQIFIHKSAEEIEQLLMALNRTSEKLNRQEDAQRSSALLLDTIREIQSQFISELNTSIVFENFMSKVVQLTKSEFGFFGEVMLDNNNKPYIQIRAFSHLALNKHTRDFYNSYDIKNLQIHNMNNLIGAAVQTKKPVIANDVTTDPRRGGLPTGHPNLAAYLGLPVFSSDRVVGVIGVANRVTGYDQGIVAYLQPLLSTCSHMIEGCRNEINRKQIQDELKRTNTTLQTILNSVSDGVITLTQDGDIISVNTTAATMFTYNTENMTGDNIHEYISGLNYRAGRLYVNGENIYLPGSNEKFKWRMEGRHKDGHVFPVEISISDYKKGNEHIYTMTIRSLEADIGTFKIKEDIISTFDLLLKDTLGSIRGSLILLKERVVGELTADVDEMIGSVYSRTEKLINLIENVKDINRIESGEIELHYKYLNIMGFIDRVLSSNQDICRQYSIGFQAAGDADYTVLGDEERLLQVVRYLVTIAARFCSPGGAVEFSAVPINEMIELIVVGYAAQENSKFIQHLMRKFSSLYGSYSETQVDGDYSLFLCRAIVDHHGGKLGCESVGERGMRLYVQIPAYTQVEQVLNR